MGITTDELAKLNAAKTAEQWNAACDEIKAARGGQYPHDWYEKVMASGLLSRAKARF